MNWPVGAKDTQLIRIGCDVPRLEDPVHYIVGPGDPSRCGMWMVTSAYPSKHSDLSIEAIGNTFQDDVLSPGSLYAGASTDSPAVDTLLPVGDQAAH